MKNVLALKPSIHCPNLHSKQTKFYPSIMGKILFVPLSCTNICTAQRIPITEHYRVTTGNHLFSSFDSRHQISHPLRILKPILAYFGRIPSGNKTLVRYQIDCEEIKRHNPQNLNVSGSTKN